MSNKSPKRSIEPVFDEWDKLEKAPEYNYCSSIEQVAIRDVCNYAEYIRDLIVQSNNESPGFKSKFDEFLKVMSKFHTATTPTTNSRYPTFDNVVPEPGTIESKDQRRYSDFDAPVQFRKGFEGDIAAYLPKFKNKHERLDGRYYNGYFWKSYSRYDGYMDTMYYRSPMSQVHNRSLNPGKKIPKVPKKYWKSPKNRKF